MRRPILCTAVTLLALFALDIAPVHARGGGRARAPQVDADGVQMIDLPSGCLARFKRAFLGNDYSAEWATLSPGFKRRLNKMVGRTVDEGDYATARQKHARDPQIRELRQWLPSAGLTRVRYRGDGYADATIRFGAPIIFGQNVRVRMVNHRLWELFIKGETQPYWGFLDDKSIRVFRTRKDNNYVVEVKDKQGKVTFRKQWKPEQVRGYRKVNRWYFDGFGKMEQEFLRNIR